MKKIDNFNEEKKQRVENENIVNITIPRENKYKLNNELFYEISANDIFDVTQFKSHEK